MKKALLILSLLLGGLMAFGQNQDGILSSEDQPTAAPNASAFRGAATPAPLPPIWGAPLSAITFPCDGGSDTLLANHASTFGWFADPLGANLITANDTFITPVLTSDTSFYEGYISGEQDSVMPLPPSNSSSSTAGVRGYYFTAPTDFVITGLWVPDDNITGNQNVAIVRFDNQTPPPIYSNSTNAFQTLGYWPSFNANDTIRVNIPVNSGDVIGIYGTRNNRNSDGMNPYMSSIGGLPVTLTRSGMQAFLTTNSPANLWSEPSVNFIARVEMFYDITPDTTYDAIDLIVPQSYNTTIDTTIAYGGGVLAGGTIQTGTGVYVDNFKTAYGCDSIITTNLKVEAIFPCDGAGDTLIASNNGTFGWYGDPSTSKLLALGDTLITGSLMGDTAFYQGIITGKYDSIAPLVSHDRTYSGDVRGYYFVAPVDFLITGVWIPNDVISGKQNIEILRFDNQTIPPGYPSTTNAFQSLGYWNNYSANDTILVNIAVDSGDVIGIYGNRDDMNSYSPSPVLGSIDGIPTTFIRSGMQANLSNNQMANVFSGGGTSIARIEMFYDVTPDTSFSAVDVIVPNSYDITTPMTICQGDSVFAGGAFQKTTGVYMDHFTTALGCDSIIRTDLTVNTVDNTTSLFGLTITAMNANATYQWLSCDSSFKAIAGETNQTFTATVNGNYAVVVTENGCADTSACVPITTVGIAKNDFGSSLRVYPNPTEGDFYVDLGEFSPAASFTLTDVLGRVVSQQEYHNIRKVKLELNQPAGMYVVTILSGEKKAVIRLTKK